jgi:hypothetical protein
VFRAWKPATPGARVRGDPWRGAAKPLRASDARAAFLRLERSPSDWNRQLTVSFRRKPESITTGDGGIEPFYRHPSQLDPGLRRDDTEMISWMISHLLQAKRRGFTVPGRCIQC